MKLNIFLKNGLILTICTILLRLAIMAFNIFLSNKIPSETLGIYGILMSVFLFVLTVALSGINLSSTKLITEEVTLGNIHNITTIIKDCFKYCLLFSSLSILILFISTPYISSNILNNIIPNYLIYLFALAVPFCSFSSCLNGYFMAVNKIRIIVISQIIEVSSQIITVYLLYKLNFFFTTNQICFALIISIVISDLCTFIYMYFEYRQDYLKYKISSSRYSYLGKICKISLPVAFTTYIKSGLSALKNSLIPIALVSYGLSHQESLSFYGLISTTVMTLILFPFTLIQSYGSLLIPELSKDNVNKNITRIKYITKKSIKTTLIFSMVISFILIVFSKWINNTFYPSLKIEYYIRILAPIIIYIYVDNIVDSILKSLDLQVYVMIINILDLVISILLIKSVIHISGINGYIFILYFSEMFNLSLSSIVLHKALSS